jgi:hypothetical protein
MLLHEPTLLSPRFSEPAADNDAAEPALLEVNLSSSELDDDIVEPWLQELPTSGGSAGNGSHTARESCGAAMAEVEVTGADGGAWRSPARIAGDDRLVTLIQLNATLLLLGAASAMASPLQSYEKMLSRGWRAFETTTSPPPDSPLGAREARTRTTLPWRPWYS